MPPILSGRRDTLRVGLDKVEDGKPVDLQACRRHHVTWSCGTVWSQDKNIQS